MAWQFLASAGLALTSGIAVYTSASSDRPAVDVVAVTSEPYRRMTVPVTIQGTGPYRFLIDTGAQATVISQALADKLALNDRQLATLVGAASRKEVETAAVDGIGLGSRTINVPRAPLVQGDYIGGADGILGLDSLQGQRVLIDFKAKLIRVADARELGGNHGYEIIVRAQRRLGQLIITRAYVDGIRTDVIVDTGAQGSTGNLALLDRMRHQRQTGVGEITDVNGSSLTGSMRLAGELSVDRAQIHNLAILFADSPTFHELGLTNQPALILGMEHLRLFNRVAIDFQSQRVLFDLPPGDPFTGSLIQRG